MKSYFCHIEVTFLKTSAAVKEKRLSAEIYKPGKNFHIEPAVEKKQNNGYKKYQLIKVKKPIKYRIIDKYQPAIAQVDTPIQEFKIMLELILFKFSYN